MNRNWTRIAGVVAAVGMLLGAPGTSSASPETLKRATGNLLMGPLDLATAPFVAGQTIYRNLREVDDSMPVKVAYTVPGYVFLTGVQLGAGVIRMIAGALEFVPGLGLVFFETDLDPLYDPVEKSDALVDYETPVLNFKFGIDYTGSAAY